jgi:hypothetical protein
MWTPAYVPLRRGVSSGHANVRNRRACKCCQKQAATFDLLKCQPQGDKQNSDFFNDYRLKIYERRKSSGVDDLLGAMRALVVQVETGDALAYLQELYLMTPYRYVASYVGAPHRIYVLQSQPEWPRFMLLEPLSPDYLDDLRRLSMMYPLARKKPNARYVGEIYHTRDRDETRKALESHSVRFHDPGETENNKLFSDGHFLFTVPSDSRTTAWDMPAKTSKISTRSNWASRSN